MLNFSNFISTTNELSPSTSSFAETESGSTTTETKETNLNTVKFTEQTETVAPFSSQPIVPQTKLRPQQQLLPQPTLPPQTPVRQTRPSLPTETTFPLSSLNIFYII